MNLTKEENDLFSQIDKELLNPPSFYIEPGLMQAYLSNDESVQITFGYIKRVLLEVTRKRGIPISENESLDLDDMLKNILIFLRDFQILILCIVKITMR